MYWGVMQGYGNLHFDDIRVFKCGGNEQTTFPTFSKLSKCIEFHDYYLE